MSSAILSRSALISVFIAIGCHYVFANSNAQPSQLVSDPDQGSTIVENHCCEELRRIGFSSSLPVVIVDLASNTLQKYVPTSAFMCTCG